MRSSDDAETKLECKEFDESDKGLTIIVSRRHRSQESEDFVKRYDRSSLQTLASVGEPINHEAWHWFNDVVGDGR